MHPDDPDLADDDDEEARRASAHSTDIFPVIQPTPDLRALRLRQWLRLAFSILLPTLLIWLIWDQLRRVDLHAVRTQISQADTKNLLAAVAAAITGIIIMGLYDAVAFPKGRKGTLPFPGRWLLGSILFGWTNFLSFGPLGGPAARMVMYSKFGLDSKEITRGFLGHYVASSSGVIAWLIAVWLPFPHGIDTIPYHASLALILTVLFAVFGGRVTALIVSRHSIGSDLKDIPLASLGIVSFLDWSLTFVCFVFTAHALGIHAPLNEMARVLYTGHAAGLISMIPGGIGSADAVWLTAFGYLSVTPKVTPAQAAGVIIFFRAIFFILPWCFSLVSIYVYTVIQAARLGTWQRSVVAGLISVMALVLLASAAAPAIHGRMDIVRAMEPLALVEISHVLAVAAAVAMFMLIRALLHGYRSAYAVILALLAVSAAVQITRGMGYEIALACLALGAVLFVARKEFQRKGRVPIGWETALSIGVGALAFYLVVGFSAFRIFPYHSEVWTTFAYGAEESRFFRGLIVIALLMIAIIVREALAPSAGTVNPDYPDIERGEAYIRTHGRSAHALLVGVGDKGIWRMPPAHPVPAEGQSRKRSTPPPPPSAASSERGLIGRSSRLVQDKAIALFQHRSNRMIIAGDPIMALGTERESVIRSLVNYSEDADLELIFYMVSEPWLDALYHSGFRFLKLCDEAVIDLASLTTGLDTKRPWLAHSLEFCESRGITCEVIEPPFDEITILAPLRNLSDEWFNQTGAHELQFSSGYFAPAYLQRNPLVVAREARTGHFIGFANLLCCEAGHTASFDLLRYNILNAGDASRYEADPEAKGQPSPSRLVDLMIFRVIEYLRARGEYQTLSLGLAPLNDNGPNERSTFVQRAAHLFSARAENAYHCHGLRTWKGRFDPLWQPRYLAYQHAWDWAPSLIACATLVRGRSHADRARIAAARLGTTPISIHNTLFP